MPSPIRVGAIPRAPLVGLRTIPLVVVLFLTAAAALSIPASYAVAAGVVVGALATTAAVSATS